MKKYPLVLIHGYPFDHTLWFSTIASLGANARVIAPDLPGFGKTPVLAEESPSMEAMADYISKTLEENSVERAVVAGMSMGGYVALAFAERHPKKLAGLGLISTQAAADSPETLNGRKQMIGKIRAEGPSAAIGALLPKLFANTEMKNPDLENYPINAAREAGIEGLCWALEAMAKRPDRTNVVTSLLLPVLVAHGNEDKLIPFAKARELAERCINPIFVEVPGAGHATPLEGPDHVASGLARLVKKCHEEQALLDQAST
jgi:pimeloyl-ACP methyl ester carboxylesterase